MINWADREAFWLNVTNAVLGLVTLIAFAAVFGGIAIEVGERAWKRVLAFVRDDPHALRVPDLGPTMADGGDRTKDRDDEERDEGQPGN